MAVTYKLDITEEPICWQQYKVDFLYNSVKHRDMSVQSAFELDLLEEYNAKIIGDGNGPYDKYYVEFKSEADAIMFMLKWS